MPESKTQPEPAACLPSPEALRLLWEGTQKALEEWGMDRQDVASLCDIVVRLADHWLLTIGSCGSPPEGAVGLVRHYRQSAAELLRRAAAPPPEPDWDKVAAALRAAGAAPLDLPTSPGK